MIDPKTYEKLGRINVIPDLEERRKEIFTDPVALTYYLAIRELIGEGHDQYVDDMFTSPDGRYLFVSRPSLADVVGINLKTQEIVWRVPVDGYRADHMAISPDGKRLLVSASTARKVLVIDVSNPAKGHIVDSFESGDSPHESQYSPDGSRIYHASIGYVYTPLDRPALDSTKGDRWFEVVDADTYEVIKRLNIGQILEEHGYEGYSSAVRPMAISPDGKTAYMQLSFFHGFVEFDLETFAPTRLALLPVSEEAQDIPREQYPLDSAHHGLAINSEGTKLCVAGTVSDYAAIVDRQSFRYKLFPGIEKPYWATNSADGQRCFVSASGEDAIVVLDYAAEKKVARIPVGDHPQRSRMGVIRKEYIQYLPNAEQMVENNDSFSSSNLLNLPF
ncbi:MAG TPA: YncE family protein [Bacillales bacterium]|nr:YncE family protein [Bacillales bacterium]